MIGVSDTIISTDIKRFTAIWDSGSGHLPQEGKVIGRDVFCTMRASAGVVGDGVTKGYGIDAKL
jgi:hypothetical protein